MNQNCKNHIAKLKELGVYEEFKKNVSNNDELNTISKLCAGLNDSSFNGFVNGAFFWSGTSEHHAFWLNISNQ